MIWMMGLRAVVADLVCEAVESQCWFDRQCLHGSYCNSEPLEKLFEYRSKLMKAQLAIVMSQSECLSDRKMVQ